FPMDALAILCSGREDRWPHFLQPVTFAHNTNPDLEIDSMAVDTVESMKTAHVCVRLALLDARLKAKN
ncbi:hypothetical protein Pmar_PMAR010103, partial [Perkinsus marinus ATCC 50983]